MYGIYLILYVALDGLVIRITNSHAREMGRVLDIVRGGTIVRQGIWYPTYLINAWIPLALEFSVAQSTFFLGSFHYYRFRSRFFVGVHN